MPIILLPLPVNSYSSSELLGGEGSLRIVVRILPGWCFGGEDLPFCGEGLRWKGWW